VEVGQGGIDLICVVEGCGIEPDDLPLDVVS
jgi:hypothetical protein